MDLWLIKNNLPTNSTATTSTNCHSTILQNTKELRLSSSTLDIFQFLLIY